MAASRPHTIRSPRRDLPFAQRTIPALLERQAARYSDKPCLRFGEAVRDYHQMRDTVARTAGALAAAGVQAGDRVAVLSGNRPEMLDLFLACGWLGAIFVPLHAALRGQQLAHPLRDSGARVLCVAGDPWDRLDRLEGEFPGLETVLVIEGAAPPAWRGRRCAPFRLADRAIDPAPVQPSDTCAILYTSGTTGPAKGVCCPHAQLFWYGLLTSEYLGMTEADVAFTCLPLAHTNALNAFVQVLCAGATYALGERFSATRYWDEVRAHGATVLYLLGSMAQILWKHDSGPGDRAHRARVALAPALAPEVLEPFAERFGVWPLDGFGTTELSLVISAPPAEQRPGRMGRAVPEFEIQVVDEADCPVADGTPGEMVLRPREPFSIMTGYWNNAPATVAAWRNLWFHTGDRVVRDADGYYAFVERIKDAIRRRGENISSYEVEHVLEAHPAVLEAAVFGVPAELGEEEVKACVVLQPGAELAPLDLIQWCEPCLAYFAVPRYLEVVPELPHTANNKVQKYLLRQRGITPATFDLERSGYRIKR